MIKDPIAFNHIEYKKPFYPLSDAFVAHLRKFSRYRDNLPVRYDDLLRFTNIVPIQNEQGEETLWNAVSYPPNELDQLLADLVTLYQMLNADGSPIEYLRVASIDFCSYGNSKPFRIKIVNDINDNHDYYYVKKADASRAFGLELEQILSPNKMNYLIDRSTLVEEHIIGIPCDEFLKKHKGNKVENRVRLAKEFVKFNERCFVRLLGDMRAYNFVVVITPDFDNIQYRLRAIDFDQQSYEGRRSMYLPQYFKDNLELVELAQEVMSVETAEQYMNEERAAMRKRLIASFDEAKSLLTALQNFELSTSEHVQILGHDLARFYKDHGFTDCKSMGELLVRNIEVRLDIQMLN